MAWFTRFTRFGDVHSCFGQEARMTSGLASALMAAYKVHKFSMGIDHPIDEETVLGISDELHGAGKILEHGLCWDELARVLNHPDLQMPTWKLVDGLSPENVFDVIVSKVGVDYGFGPSINCNLVILQVVWTHNNHGHWVVIDSVRNILGLNYATLCDPLDAAIHIVPLHKGIPFSYSAEQTIALNLWGKEPLHNFQTPRTAIVAYKYVKDMKTHYKWMNASLLIYRDPTPIPEATFEPYAHFRKFDDMPAIGLRGDRAGEI